MEISKIAQFNGAVIVLFATMACGTFANAQDASLADAVTVELAASDLEAALDRVAISRSGSENIADKKLDRRIAEATTALRKLEIAMRAGEPKKSTLDVYRTAVQSIQFVLARAKTGHVALTQEEAKSISRLLERLDQYYYPTLEPTQSFVEQ